MLFRSIKSPDCNKGSEVGRLLANRRYDFVIAMGDDTTDEDMFQALPKSAIAIKIGSVSEAANYHLSAQSDVLPFLRSLLGKQKTATKVPCLWQAAHLPRPGYGIRETTRSGWEIK